MYYETGELKSMGKFVNGKMKGLWKDYFKQGKLMKAGNYASGGYEHGEWKSYFETGEIYQTRLYNLGLVMEIISCFDGKGNELDKGTLEKGTGVVNEYDIDGNLIKQITYYNGIEDMFK